MYRTFGSDRRKLVDNAYAATRQWRHSSMTSVFIDAQLRSASEMTYIVSGGALNSTHSLTPTRSWDARQSILTPNFDGFGENLTPYMFSAIVQTPKRHFLAWLRVIWVIVRENPPKDHFSRRVRGKKWCYISRICPDVPLRPIGTNFGLLVRLVDVINCAKFYRNRSRSFDSVRGRSLEN